MRYIHKLTGAVISVPCEVRGENWVAVEEEPAATRPEEAPSPSKGKGKGASGKRSAKKE